MLKTSLRSSGICQTALALFLSALALSTSQAQVPSTQTQSDAVNNPNGKAATAIQGSSAASVGATGGDMKSMMTAMNDKMAPMQMTGKQDMDFAMMMRMHHQSGIDMAQMQLRDGTDPAMRKLARSIIAAQKKEIAQMDMYLSKQNGAMRMGKQ